jgi:hypothetical protein
MSGTQGWGLTTNAYTYERSLARLKCAPVAFAQTSPGHNYRNRRGSNGRAVKSLTPSSRRRTSPPAWCTLAHHRKRANFTPSNQFAIGTRNEVSPPHVKEFKQKYNPPEHDESSHRRICSEDILSATFRSQQRIGSRVTAAESTNCEKTESTRNWASQRDHPPNRRTTCRYPAGERWRRVSGLREVRLPTYPFSLTPSSNPGTQYGASGTILVNHLPHQSETSWREAVRWRAPPKPVARVSGTQTTTQRGIAIQDSRRTDQQPSPRSTDGGAAESSNITMKSGTNQVPRQPFTTMPSNDVLNSQPAYFGGTKSVCRKATMDYWRRTGRSGENPQVY